MRDPVVAWLMAGDPAVRWQVMRDLLRRPEKAWRRERERVATTGWGRRLLARQRPDGNWGLAPYRPKWTCTTYTMQLLRQLGLPPRNRAALRACAVELEEGVGPDGGINFWRPRRRIGEACVTGMILSQLAWFEVDDDRVERLVDYLLREQMPDGGWNCRRPEGAVHSSFHTTTSVVEGLVLYGAAGRARAGESLDAAARGRRFLAEHRLFRSHTTGRSVATELTRLHFPPQWHHDVLRGLDLFRAAAAPRDARLEEAVERVRSRRGPDGRWALARPYPGAVHFTLEAAGRPSRVVTLLALRVLSWWEGR
jgi:Prenyltransferase and squalene oxidase repeat